jgi:hypothetical protein
MSKWILTLILILATTTPTFALGVIDAMTCKRVVLHEANDRTVLVDRLTGEVKYALQNTGQWVPVQGDRKKKYQSMYNAQIHPNKP